MNVRRTSLKARPGYVTVGDIDNRSRTDQLEEEVNSVWLSDSHPTPCSPGAFHPSLPLSSNNTELARRKMATNHMFWHRD